MKTVLFICISMLFLSCSPIRFQVFKMQDKNEFENEDIKVCCDFWAEYGNSGFSIYNKTNKPIYVNLSTTHSIINLEAKTFYQGKSWTEKLDQKRITVNDIGIKEVRYVSLEETTRQQEIVIIPANSYKKLNGFEICSVYRENNFDGKAKGEKQFIESNTPVKIKNIINYSLGENINKTFEFTNWAKSVEIYKYLPIPSSDKFYVRYIRRNNMLNSQIGLIKK